MTEQIKPVHVIGGGLAGSEATWQLVQKGIPVILHEMRPVRKTDAHLTDGLAELVCSNSFRSDDAENNAVGLLHKEMRELGSLIMESADENKVPAGGALAVDRVEFSSYIQNKLENNPLVTIEREEIKGLPPEEWGNCLIATGPLTSPELAEAVHGATGADALSFFDAIAPIVYKDSINFDIAWFQSRYDKGEGTDYINCPLTKEQYYEFISDLNEGGKTEFKEWEKDTPYFDGCLPIEVMAERGPETLRYGPMKPVGLTDPNNPDVKPYGIVQLRQDNKLGTIYNIVGFQTKLKYAEQTRIFKKIPGLENAEFARLGGLHRNTFINSPEVLDKELRLKNVPRLRFAGQVTGVEGYVESTAVGLMAGRFLAAETLNETFSIPPQTTAFGALMSHITGDAETSTFQPMNVNFGLFPPLEVRVKKKERKQAYTKRAFADFAAWKEDLSA
ncbi:MAG: methylenetetrahydrofolate--tRNA-(uracil(54)-C(5))-methyltransferase (FADH(2)-oxidizing) TrmFO [Sneathiellales bacterium]|nr:methylenetetrahydrofolate--tRNA-(uracil(54)-C(5))-methyltransferase (FADH(2)-oxidizing) TrmFO [Sneathiellales bacterium]